MFVRIAIILKLNAFLRHCRRSFSPIHRLLKSLNNELSKLMHNYASIKIVCLFEIMSAGYCNQVCPLKCDRIKVHGRSITAFCTSYSCSLSNSHLISFVDETAFHYSNHYWAGIVSSKGENGQK